MILIHHQNFGRIHSTPKLLLSLMLCSYPLAAFGYDSTWFNCSSWMNYGTHEQPSRHPISVWVSMIGRCSSFCSWAMCWAATATWSMRPVPRVEMLLELRLYIIIIIIRYWESKNNRIAFHFSTWMCKPQEIQISANGATVMRRHQEARLWCRPGIAILM